MTDLTKLVEQATKAISNLQEPREDLADLLEADQIVSDYSIGPIIELTKPFNINHDQMLKKLVSFQSVGREVSADHNADKIKIFDQGPAPLLEKKRAVKSTDYQTALPLQAINNGHQLPGDLKSSGVERGKGITEVLARFRPMDYNNEQVFEVGRTAEIIGKTKEAASIATEKGKMAKAIKSKARMAPQKIGQNWFAKKTYLKEAAATLISAKPKAVSDSDLRRWLNLPAKRDTKVRPDNEKYNLASRVSTVIKPYQVDSKRQGLPSKFSNATRQEAAISGKSPVKKDEQMSEQKTGHTLTAANPLKGTSQLEMLVNSWQQKGHENSPEAAVELAVSGNRPDLPDLAKKSTPSHKHHNFELRQPEKSRAQNDHFFAETLERVLKREMGRFGLGEEN